VSYPSILVVYSTSRKHTTTSTGSWELGSGMGDGNGDSDGKRRRWEKERDRDVESDRDLENCNARWGVFLFAWHFCFLRALFSPAFPFGYFL